MVKEIETAVNEFLEIFPKLDSVYFYREFINNLKPYSDMGCGKEIVLEIYQILYSDRVSNSTILHPKPCAFKTDLQEEHGADAKFSTFHEMSIGDFRSNKNKYNYINSHKIWDVLCKEKDFEIFMKWFENKYDFLAHIPLYRNNEITLSELRNKL